MGHIELTTKCCITKDKAIQEIMARVLIFAFIAFVGMAMSAGQQQLICQQLKPNTGLSRAAPDFAGIATVCGVCLSWVHCKRPLNSNMLFMHG
jgi:hypothetical protein